MFEPQDTPRVFSVAVGNDFLRNFVKGLREKVKNEPPEFIGRVEVFVNTRRMARRLHEMLIAEGAVFLPKIQVISDIANHPNLPIVLPEPVSKLRRQLILAQLVGQLLNSDASIAPQSAKFDLAQSLAALLDEMQGEGIAVSALFDISVDDESGHWQRSLAFLNILAQHWDGETATDPQDRQRQAAEAFAQAWAIDPPRHPVLAIGSTGSRGETALFLQAVAKLPNGAVVLPGVDLAMKAENWDALSDPKVAVDNPQSALVGFCNLVGVRSGEIPLWHPETVANSARNALISLALRPAPFTDQWLNEGPELATELPTAIDGVTLIEAETPKDEALAVAIRLRAAVEDGQRAVLITPDRTLTRRVTAALDRWGILPDDSAGRPLHLTPPGIFLRLISQAMGQRVTPLTLVSLLKHPLTASSAETGSNRRFVREYEKQKLRGGAPFVDFVELLAWADKDTNDPSRRVWADWVVRCLQPLASVPDGDLATLLDLHLSIAEELAAGPEGSAAHRLWELETGEKTQAVFDRLRAEVDAAGDLSVADYNALIQTIMRGETVREARASHAGVAIWGTLEARVESADLVILGGLNDPVWPGVENPDPWLNRKMRKQIGLPPPERITGLSAHDFQQGCGAKELVLSRSARDGDAPTVASRWIVRILNLMNGLRDVGKQSVNDIVKRGEYWLELAAQFEHTTEEVTPAVRPAPVPPVGKRFNQLSVTQIERLIRDPYAVYAQKILGLKRLDPLGREPDALIRGIALHAVVEQFAKEFPDTLPDDAEKVLISVAEQVLRDEVPWPALQRIWLARLARIAGWFVDGERDRRERAQIVAQEVSGRRRVEAVDFELTAKADRIDMDEAGSVWIYDYKSGSPPSEAQTEFFNKQLQLEAAIAAVGGFDTVDAATPAGLEYIGLSGSGLARDGKTLALETGSAEAEAIWQELVQLITAYHSAEKGFPARMRMEKMAYSYEFDHLSRKGEWEESDPPVDIPVGDRT